MFDQMPMLNILLLIMNVITTRVSQLFNLELENLDTCKPVIFNEQRLRVKLKVYACMLMFLWKFMVNSVSVYMYMYYDLDISVTRRQMGDISTVCLWLCPCHYMLSTARKSPFLCPKTPVEPTKQLFCRNFCKRQLED